MIRLLQPRVPNADAVMPYVRRIDEARHYSNFGPLVKELEARLAKRYPGCYVVTVSSATTGLELVYTLKAMQGYRKIDLPSLTFPATWLAAARAGLLVTPLDVHPETWVAPGVSGFGLPTYAPVVDAAGAFGEQAVPLVRGGMTAVFSLHATKPLGCGEGGYIVTWDEAEAQEIRRMSNFGIHQGKAIGFGTNAKMSEYHAAIALAALDAWDREPWLQLYDWYAKHLPSCVVAQKRPRGVYSLMPVRLPVSAQDALDLMREAGVETRRWYCPPMHKHPMFRRKAVEERKKSLPVTEDLAEHLLGLPYHTYLTEDDVQSICFTLDKVVNEVAQVSKAAA